ncbi:MAG: 2-C-methyl-D-erythritol 4-phosphate cytidylyltransferase [Coriobacteriales bacterium]|jgi:2-C-methyl-D-erythritol 4-phosphate cytidylyltransferase
MSNVALIFAGGTGQRMNTKTRPKQFLELHGKPIIIYTLEHFDSHPLIDGIVVVCLESWIPFLKKMLKKFDITKVVDVIPGGDSGQASIRNGVMRAAEQFEDDSVVLVHDGVRPLIDEDTITSCIEKTREFGSAITTVPAIETVIREEDGLVSNIIDRSECAMAKAPQCFRLGELKEAHQRAIAEGRDDFIDSASLMRWCGHDLYSVTGRPENIKITTPSDFYIFRALVDAQENSQIFGF